MDSTMSLISKIAKKLNHSTLLYMSLTYISYDIFHNKTRQIRLYSQYVLF